MDHERVIPPQCKWGDGIVPIIFVCVLPHDLLSRLSSFARKSQFLREDHARLCSFDVHEYVARLQGKRCGLEFLVVIYSSGSGSKLKISLKLIMLLTMCNLLKALL